MSIFRTRFTSSSPKPSDKKVVFSGKRVKGTWIMETDLPVPVRRSALHSEMVVSDNRRVRTLH